ncbi:MAG: CrcB family protein [Acidobacteriota bacterium]|nr:CrcB family protein [Acidobacteriota bacterium]
MAATTGAPGEVIGRRRRRHASDVAIVGVGGLFGAAARQAVEQAIHRSPNSFPVATLVVNLAGSVVLGVLLEVLARSGGDTGRLRDVRLVAGTGFIGAFTTYSTLAVESDLLVRAGHVATAAGYVAVSVVGGLVGAGLGIAGAARFGHPSAGSMGALPLDPDVDGTGA